MDIRQWRIPSPVSRLVEHLHQNGVHSILVGGSVRDFFLKREQDPLDLDIEIRHRHPRERIIALVEQSRPESVECLPFDIIRLEFAQMSLELAPPRREEYPAGEWFKHDQFEAFIDPSLNPAQAWLRRDFTVNAIGFDLISKKLVDPFHGLTDLNDKVLRPCGPDFFLDPVRLLRLLRFQFQLGFSLHPDTKGILSRFNLKGLGSHHFFKESFKTSFTPFIQKFFDTAQEHSIALPAQMDALEFLRHLSSSPDNLDDLLMTVLYAPSPPHLTQLKDLAKYAKVGIEPIRQHYHFRQHLEQLGSIDKNFLKKEIEQNSMQDVLDLPQLEWVKKAHRFLARHEGRHPFAHSLKRVNPSLCEALSSLQKIFPSQLKGDGPFPDQLSPDKREAFRLYRHLMDLKTLPIE